MTNKSKWLTILVCFIALTVLGAAGAWNRAGYMSEEMGDFLDEHDMLDYDDEDDEPDRKIIESADDLAGAKLVGMTGRMPDNSAKIFFESMLGRKLASYTGYDSIDECLYALHSGKADAMWVADVSAYYLTEKDFDLDILDTSEMAAIENTEEPRFSFGMATANTAEGKALVEQLDYALDFLDGDGILARLQSDYIDYAPDAEPYTVKNMVVNDSVHKIYYYSTEPIVVGVTGAVPPIELIDANGNPYGFCVALMDEIGQVLQRGVKFVVLDNETAFTSLMSGRVDVIFCYGSGRITTEGTKDWCMTRGYYDMQKYEFLYLY